MKKRLLNDARIIITGASSGIGRALAYRMAAEGARIGLVARNRGRLVEVAEDIAKLYPVGPKPLVYSCDVGRMLSVSKLVRDFDLHYGGIDILINNAGTGVYGDVEKTTMKDFNMVMAVNYYGAANCMLKTLPVMKKMGGVIVNITSVAARYGVPYLGAYGASKAALVALSQSLRAELSQSGVSIMIVYPGYTQTAFFDHEKKVGGARRPRGPFMSPEKVAQAISNAMIHGKDDLVLSREGKALTFSQRFLPWLVDIGMARIAQKLRV
jgi:short-subunit dehydrogenase